MGHAVMEIDDIGHITRRKGPDVGVLLIVAIAGLLGSGYVAMAIAWGFDSDEALKVGIAVLLAGASAFGLWAELRSLLLLGQRGVSHRSFRGTVTLPFEKVSSVAILRVGGDSLLTKDLVTGKQSQSTSLTIGDGSKSIELSSGTFGADTEFESLSQQLTAQIAGRLLEQLEKTGAAPLLPGLELRDGKIVGTLASEAIDIPPNTAPPAYAVKPQRLELSVDDERHSIRVRSGWAYLYREQDLLAVISVGARNFFPTMEVLAQASSWELS